MATIVRRRGGRDREARGMAFTRMDEGTLDDWMVIAQETVPYQQQVADRVLAMLRTLQGFTGGFGVDQLAHALRRPPARSAPAPPRTSSWGRSATTSAR